MSTSDNYTRFTVGDEISFTTVKQSSRGSISMTNRHGVVVDIQGRVLVVKSRGKQYGIRDEDARKVGEKSTLTEFVESLAVSTEVKP